MTKISISHALKFLFLLTACVLIGCSGVQLGPSQNETTTPRPIAKTMIAFATRNSDSNLRGIYVMNADGTDVQQITQDGTSPAWSPDAKEIAYEGFFQNDDWLFVTEPDGSANKRIAYVGYGTQSHVPVWSPNGVEIAFEVARKNSENTIIPSIHIVNLAQAKEREISCEGNQYCILPDWSSDGKYLAFTLIWAEHYPADIARVDLAKGSSYEIIQKDADYPHFQPHSDKIAFAANRNGKEGIFLMNADGTRVQLVVPKQIITMEPIGLAWSPDGTRLAFVTTRDSEGKGDIYVVNVDGSHLTDTLAFGESPTWSPDGKQIAFSSNRDGHFEIYAVNVDGTNLRRLTNSPNDKFDPVWSPR